MRQGVRAYAVGAEQKPVVEKVGLPEKSPRRLSVLRLVNSIGETSAPYNQFSLALADRHDVTICTFFPSDVEVPPEISLYDGDGSVRGFFRVLGAALRTRAYDVIHVHSPHTGVLFLAANLIHRRALRSTVFTAHNSYRNFKPRNRLLLLPVFLSFQRVVCCGKASFESFPGLYRRLAGRRFCHVQNGVDVERVDRVLRERLPSETGTFEVVSVGRLIRIKDPLVLLRAFRQAAGDDSSLRFIGEGEMKGTISEYVRKANLERQVRLSGLVPRCDVYETLSRASVFVSTSRGEGLPVAALEAMCCGCPVVLSDIPPHREIAGQADFIPLIRPGDIGGFAKEIERFRRMPAAARREIGRRCRQLVETKFSLKSMHEGYERLYDQIVGR